MIIELDGHLFNSHDVVYIGKPEFFKGVGDTFLVGLSSGVLIQIKDDSPTCLLVITQRRAMLIEAIADKTADEDWGTPKVL